MFRRGFFLLAAPALLALLLTPAEGAAQFYRGGSFGARYYGGYSYGYRGGYGYYPGYAGFARGYSYPGYYSRSDYAPLYYSTPSYYSWGYSAPSYYSPGYYAAPYAPPSYYSPQYNPPQYSPPAVAPASYPSSYPAESGGPEMGTGDAPATVEVQLPADAELWFGSHRPNQTGGTRIFQSPTLAAGRPYTYEIRARWNQDGRLVDQTRTVEVRAGRVARVDFLTADRAEVAPAPRERPVVAPLRDYRTAPPPADRRTAPPPDPTPPVPEPPR
jgi:uncharacterized protein (TIGR03000 family)